MSLYSKFSPQAKMLSWLITLPAVAIALYLYWSGNDIMSWVDGAKETVSNEYTSTKRANKYGYFIVVFSVGIPALIPSFAYDYVKKKGLFRNRK